MGHLKVFPGFFQQGSSLVSIVAPDFLEEVQLLSFVPWLQSFQGSLIICHLLAGRDSGPVGCPG